MVMDTVCGDDSGAPLGDQTNTWAVYVPAGRFKITYAVDDPEAATLTVAVPTYSVTPAAFVATAKTIPVSGLVNVFVTGTITAG